MYKRKTAGDREDIGVKIARVTNQLVGVGGWAGMQTNCGFGRSCAFLTSSTRHSPFSGSERTSPSVIFPVKLVTSAFSGSSRSGYLRNRW